MRCLVTGAAGFIGSHLTERLLKEGHSVRAIDCFAPYYSVKVKRFLAEQSKAQGAEWFEYDLAKDPLDDVISGVDVIFHLAAQPGIARISFPSYLENNIVATERLVNAALKAKVGFFVNMATSSIYGSVAVGGEDVVPAPISWYGVTKLAAEQLVLSYVRKGVLQGCSVRPFSVFGERERPEKMFPQLILATLTKAPFTLYQGSLDHVRSFTYVGDVVEACLKILSAQKICNGEIINIGNPETFLVKDAVRLIEELMGEPCRIAEAPAREGDQQETKAQIGKAERLLGFSPTTNLRTVLEKEIIWFKDHLQLYV